MTVKITVQKATHEYGIYLLGTLPPDIPITTLIGKGVGRFADPQHFEAGVDNSMNVHCAEQTCSLDATFDTVSDTRLGLGQWEKDPGAAQKATRDPLTIEGPDGARRIKLKGIPPAEGIMWISWDCTPNLSPQAKPAM